MDLTWPLLLAGALLVQIYFSRKKRRELSARIGSLRSDLDDASQRLIRERADSDSRQAALFDQMVEGVIILDGQARVRLVNAALRDRFVIREEVVGRRLIEAIRSHELQEIVDEAGKLGHALGRELTLSAGREMYYFSVNASRFSIADSASEGVIVIFHDLTNLKRMESGRREFVANVSHELRTPLSMIKGYVETLLEGNIEDEQTEARFLGKIQKHSDRLTYLIEDLLALSQLESGQVALSCVRVPLASLVERVLEDLQDRATNRGITLKANVSRELVVCVDPDRIQQVLQNLIDNGIKYGKREGTVALEAEENDTNEVVVTVADDGPGIPADMHDRVFERFFRVDKARSREQGGTGLGLAIVKHIIQSHGGRVWVGAGESSGAVFNFTLPADAPPSARRIDQ